MKPLPQEIVIVPFEPKYQSQAKSLVLAGLQEHWGILDPGKNPDLNDISASYAGGLFLIALRNDELIGTGAILPRPAHIGEVVRMSVVANMRRNGIGKMILDKLCDHARANGYRRVVLETTATWHEVIEFYKNYGFHITHDLGGDIYFSLEL